MSEPRETARQIAERTDLLVEQHTASPLIAYREELVEAIEAHVASLTADLAQARQERDAAQKAMAYSSEQAHLEWTRANKAEGDLTAAEQTRDEALKEAAYYKAHLIALHDDASMWRGKAARTALLESAEDEKAMTELVEALTKIVDWESVNAAATFSEAAWTHIEAWLTTRAGGPRT